MEVRDVLCWDNRPSTEGRGETDRLDVAVEPFVPGFVVVVVAWAILVGGFTLLPRFAVLPVLLLLMPLLVPPLAASSGLSRPFVFFSFFLGPRQTIALYI
jgi:hypothetical protein